jgi:hypothetical protein
MRYFLPIVFIAAAALGLWLLFNPDLLAADRKVAAPQTRTVLPQTVGADADETASDEAERMAYEDVAAAKVALADNETPVAVITQDFDGDPQDEQIIAFRRGKEGESGIHLAYVDFDDASGAYMRVWEASTAATKARTFSLFVKDLIGDRSHCVVATGLNESGEQTMTIFRKRPSPAEATAGGAAPPARTATGAEIPFDRIAELRTDGAASILETDRSQAYQVGVADGVSFKIAIYGRDFESANLLDQIETTYTWDPGTGRYERTGTARIPGTQIEQRRIRELLNGSPDNFELFLDGLWQLETPAGAPADRASIFFDAGQRELIFYADATQEVFSWQNSNATRYGLYLTTQNISVTTLRRLVDIELVSVDTVRIKVFEDVKLKIGVSGRWDGTYRKIVSAAPAAAAAPPAARQSASYDGAAGQLVFLPDGSFAWTAPTAARTGNYAFVDLDGQEYLELRSGTDERATYRVDRANRSTQAGRIEEMTLTKVRLSVNGAEDLHENALTFSRSLQ